MATCARSWATTCVARCAGCPRSSGVLVSGSPDEVRGDPRVVEAYLGAPPEEVEAQLQEVTGDVEPTTGRHALIEPPSEDVR